ncbi:MAG: TIGR00730 family Rossman fold protein [Chloroflexi bacterium HGW-Chloroflexi-3]|nr:MAG: TIGR00730 family Rossman fold protein [Chloroflexi bacterium HGW-Chloroflexi-3]
MMVKTVNSICVYCGSADGLKKEYYDAAYHLGQLLANQNITLVYGAGKTGLMGAVANGVLDNNGKVIGVVPKLLNEPQLIHSNLTELVVLPDIHQRKARMSELADAFIALPGGFGTFDELFETLTWAQIGIHQKPIGLLNVNHYFEPLLSVVEHALNENFIYAEHKVLLINDAEPLSLLEKITSFQQPEGLKRWISRE